GWWRFLVRLGGSGRAQKSSAVRGTGRCACSSRSGSPGFHAANAELPPAPRMPVAPGAPAAVITPATRSNHAVVPCHLVHNIHDRIARPTGQNTTKPVTIRAISHGVHALRAHPRASPPCCPAAESRHAIIPQHMISAPDVNVTYINISIAHHLVNVRRHGQCSAVDVSIIHIRQSWLAALRCSDPPTALGSAGPGARRGSCCG